MNSNLTNIALVALGALQLITMVAIAVLGFVVAHLRSRESELRAATNNTAVHEVRITSIEARLLTGAAHMKNLDEKDHELRVEVLKAINDLRGHMVTKDDLRALKEELRNG